MENLIFAAICTEHVHIMMNFVGEEAFEHERGV